MESKKGLSRRQFVSTAAGVAAFTIVPRHVLGGPGYKAPSDKLNIAGVGVGGMGKNNVKNSSGENIVALCDVDFEHASKIFKLYPKAKTYKDYRVMLDKQKDIDAVIIATPDHTHAIIAAEAIRHGKHVYVQKPLTHSIYEARKLRELAKKYNVKTQMGNQGHSGEGIRYICEWIWNGAIGDVRKVEAWTDRPGGRWYQGILRPEDTPPVPKDLDWDLWLGPAPKRAYNPAYHPFKWRGFWDFGTGSLGDMACHIMDPIFWSLKLQHPTSVEAVSSITLKGDTTLEETAPVASIVRYKYPARGSMPEVKLTWYDGGLMPERPEVLEARRMMGDSGGGVLFHGDKGMIMCGTYAKGPRLIPETAMRAYKQPGKSIPRIQGTHEDDWIKACKGEGQACSNFEVAGPMTEAVLIGNIAIKAKKKLEWDGDNMKVTNNEEADKLVNPAYRKGWKL
jgi:predicted dehydrogenase